MNRSSWLRVAMDWNKSPPIATACPYNKLAKAWRGRSGILALDRGAFYRGTIRSLDRDGRLHVDPTPISKAMICPYIGHEIPGGEELGLDPDKVYRLYRDPAELEKAAPTFNKLPVLAEHLPVNAEEYSPDLIVGATGERAEYRKSIAAM
jgi:hypothetical protein